MHTQSVLRVVIRKYIQFSEPPVLSKTLADIHNAYYPRSYLCAKNPQ